MAIVVSFAHMVTTIALYSSGAWYAGLVAGAMTLLIDIAIYELIEYLLGAHRAGWRPAWPVPAFLALAIVLSISLNGAYLWAYRPPAAVVPDWLSMLITSALAVFVPGWIAIAAIMSAELEGRRAAHQAQVDELAQLRADVAELRTAAQDRDQARARVAQLEGETARLLPDLAQQSESLAQLRATLEDRTREAAQWSAQVAHVDQAARAAVAQRDTEAAILRAQLDEARAVAELDPRDIAHRLREAGVATRTIARGLERPESTVRGWITERTA
jgi:hypothetical protein